MEVLLEQIKIWEIIYNSEENWKVDTKTFETYFLLISTNKSKLLTQHAK